MFVCTKCELFDDIICVSCYSPCRPVVGFTNLCPNNLYNFISDQDTILRVVIHEICHTLVRSVTVSYVFEMCNQSVFCLHCSAQWFNVSQLTFDFTFVC